MKTSASAIGELSPHSLVDLPSVCFVVDERFGKASSVRHGWVASDVVYTCRTGHCRGLARASAYATLIATPSGQPDAPPRLASPTTLGCGCPLYSRPRMM